MLWGEVMRVLWEKNKVRLSRLVHVGWAMDAS